MSISDFLNEFNQRKAAVAEFKREINALQQKKSADETALEREIRDLVIALFKTVGIDVTAHDLHTLLGAAERIADHLHSGRDADRLRKRGKDLEERFVTALAEVKTKRLHADQIMIDEGLLVDRHATTPVDLLLVLQKNPVENTMHGNAASNRSPGDQIDSVANRYGLKRYTHINARNPVCVLVGEVKPADIARFADEHDGVMLRNKSGGRFRSRGPAEKKASSSKPSPKLNEMQNDAALSASAADPMPASVSDHAADDPSIATSDSINVTPEPQTGAPDSGKGPASDAPKRADPRKLSSGLKLNSANQIPGSKASNPKRDASQSSAVQQSQEVEGDDALTSDRDDRHETGGQS